MSDQNTDQWQLAIDENQNYIKLGKAMQQRGTVVLNSIPITGALIDFERVNYTGIAKLMNAATKAIDRGVAMERTARENLRRQMKGMKITINGCARCGESHEVEFLPFAKSVIELDAETLTHWGICPNLNEPILMRIETKPDADEED